MKRKKKKRLFIPSVVVIVLVFLAVIAVVITARRNLPDNSGEMAEYSEEEFDTQVLNREEKAEKNVEENSQKRPEEETTSDNSWETGTEAGTEAGVDVYNIPGYINGVSEDEAQVVCGISLPYTVLDTPITIRGIGQYSGPFVEDGSDTPTVNALALVVRNDSDTVAEYVELKLMINDTDEAVFQISTLPPGEEAVVLEKSGKAYETGAILTFTDKLYARQEELSLEEEQVAITAKDETLQAKNLTEEDMDTILIRYKRKISETCYLGGITYNCTIENVKAGESVQAKTQHFSADRSRILMVEIINE